MEVKPLLRRKTYLHSLQNEILIRWGGGLSDRAKAQWLKEITDNMLYTAFTSLRYDFVEFMLENHIDVFGLIDVGYPARKQINNHESIINNIHSNNSFSLAILAI